MKTVAIINLKGGTAKTTTAVNLAAELRQRGKRVLLIDADPQHNLSDYMGADPDAATITDLLAARCIIAEDLVQHLAPDLGIVPSDLSLCEIDIEAIQRGISLRSVRDLCEALSPDYDVCLIDCPPSFTAASIAALVAADEAILPVTVDAFAMGGALEIARQIENLQSINETLKVRGILLTMWSRSLVCMQANDVVRRAGLPVFDTVIRRTCKVQEASFKRESLRKYAPHCNAAEDYDALCDELLKKWRWM